MKVWWSTAASSLGVSRESQGLEIRRMLGPSLKQCSSTASGNAGALLQAMLKHAEGYRVRVVRTTYGQHE
jgi:hypothetical protein